MRNREWDRGWVIYQITNYNTTMFNNLEFKTNSILRRDSISDETVKSRVPEGALYFSWYVSDWEKNRNGYIIEADAWFADGGAFVNDFLATGSILWNHDSDKPIGRPLSFAKTEDNKIFVTGYVFDDTASEGAIGRGLVLGLSTWHYTYNSMMRNDAGVKISMDDYWKLPIEEVFSNNWTEVVTNAEIAEFSFVSVRSNRASTLTTKVEQYARVNKIDTKQVYSLISNNSQTMTIENVDTPEVVAEAPAEVVEVTPEVVVEEAPVVEAPADNALADSVAKLTSLVETLSADVSALKANSTSRETQRANLANVVTTASVVDANAITHESFLAKYRK